MPRNLCALAMGMCAILITACQSNPSVPSVPAIPANARMVSEKTDALCLAQMQNAVQRRGAGRVVLTRAAFAVDNRLSIVPTETVVDAAGLPANGRTLGKPDSFRLTLENGVCSVQREADGQTTLLPACTCTIVQMQ